MTNLINYFGKSTKCLLLILAIYSILLLSVFYFGSINNVYYRTLLQNTRQGHHLSDPCWMGWHTHSVSSIMRGKCLKASRDGLWIPCSGSLHLPGMNTPQWFSLRIQFPTLHALTWCLGRYSYFYLIVLCIFIGVFMTLRCLFSESNLFISNIGGPRKHFAGQDYWQSCVNKPISFAWIKPLGSSSHFCCVPPWSPCWCISWATCGSNYWVRCSQLVWDLKALLLLLLLF